MKKLFFLASLAAALFTASAKAQPPGGPGGDPQQMRQRMIERIKPQLVDSVKLSQSEADKVLDIYLGSMQQRRDIRMDNNLGDEEKGKKMEALNEEASKKYKAIPLTDEQVKAVSAFFDEMQKRRMNRNPQGGGNQ